MRLRMIFYDNVSKQSNKTLAVGVGLSDCAIPNESLECVAQKHEFALSVWFHENDAFLSSVGRLKVCCLVSLWL